MKHLVKVSGHAGLLAQACASILLCGMLSSPLFAQSAPTVMAAGSLREAMEDLAQHWQKAGNALPKGVFGASGLLRERIAAGEAADLFASANTEHPQALHQAGMGEAPRVFARNRMCVLSQADLPLYRDTLLARLLDPAIKLGTSTPKADPAGDYAWLVFARADALQPGAREALEHKALQLAGGPQSPRPPQGQGTYAWLMATRQADVFLTYCTNAAQTLRALPTLNSLELPTSLQVEAQYGLIVLRPAGRAFADFILSPDGQAVLRKHGFATPH
jgi:molybdate transport system substrate-binding protein